MRFLFKFFLLLFSITVSSCSEYDQQHIETAERQYASLYLALNEDDRKVAKKAASSFENQMNRLGYSWVPPGSEGDTEIFHFRLERAARAWKTMTFAIDKDDLPMAALQLDRATYELSIAHPASFSQLEMGRFYPVLSSWASLNSILQDEEFCGFSLPEVERYRLKVVNCLSVFRAGNPEDLLYARSDEELTQFHYLFNNLNKQLNELNRSINFQDRALIHSEIKRIDLTINDVLKLFAAAAEKEDAQL